MEPLQWPPGIDYAVERTEADDSCLRNLQLALFKLQSAIQKVTFWSWRASGWTGSRPSQNLLAIASRQGELAPVNPEC